MFSIENTAAGILNFGTINGSLQNIDASISILKDDHSMIEFCQVIKKFSEEISNSEELSIEKKAETLELISGIIDEMKLSKNRRRKSLILSLLKSISDTVSGVGSLIKIWQWIRPIIENF